MTVADPGGGGGRGPSLPIKAGHHFALWTMGRSDRINIALTRNAPPPPRPVKNSHKKHGRRAQWLIYFMFFASLKFQDLPLNELIIWRNSVSNGA